MRAQRALHGPAWLGPHRAVPRSGPAGAPGGGDSLRGEWSAMPSGQLVWRLALRSPGALSMRVRFESFDVAGALWLHAGSGAAWAGPYTGRGPHGDGHFWSDVVFSDSVTVAYVPSGRAEAAAPPGFRIPLIAHELAPPRAPRARQAAPCHQDVTCHPGWKSAWGWQSPAIAMLRVESSSGTAQCSGTLVNLGLVGDELALLTAAHCVGDAAQARDTVFFWGYQSLLCELVTQVPQTRGARLLATQGLDRFGDFSLLALPRAAVLAVTEVTEAAWTANALLAPGTDVIGISHPAGQAQRIAFGVTVERTLSPDPQRYVDVAWHSGTTESGSSGSGLFLPDGRLVGVLKAGRAGRAPCNYRYSAYYHRFADIYEQLRPLLEGGAAGRRPVEIELGVAGTIQLEQALDGSYTLDGRPFESGGTVRAANGSQYRLSLEDGAWRATYRQRIVEVPLATSGGAAALYLLRAEDGSYRYQGQPVADGSTITTGEGLVFRLRRSAAGLWRAVFQPHAVAPPQPACVLPLRGGAGRRQRIVLLGPDGAAVGLAGAHAHEISVPGGGVAVYETAGHALEPPSGYAEVTVEPSECCRPRVVVQASTHGVGSAAGGTAAAVLGAAPDGISIPFDNRNAAGDAHICLLATGGAGGPAEVALAARSANTGELLGEATVQLADRGLHCFALAQRIAATAGAAGALEVRALQDGEFSLAGVSYLLLGGTKPHLVGSGQ